MDKECIEMLRIWKTLGDPRITWKTHWDPGESERPWRSRRIWIPRISETWESIVVLVKMRNPWGSRDLRNPWRSWGAWGTFRITLKKILKSQKFRGIQKPIRILRNPKDPRESRGVYETSWKTKEIRKYLKSRMSWKFISILRNLKTPRRSWGG